MKTDKKVYSCFAFFNELDLLEIRLNEENEFVDRWVIVECKKSFSGLSKPLHYLENKERFAEFNHKIIHVTADFRNGGAWHNDVHQKNELKKGLTGCQPNDLIIFSDLDELPDLRNVDFDKIDDVYSFEQQGFRCFLNSRHALKLTIAKIFPYHRLNGKSLADMRGILHADKIISPGGWHFSFLGGAEKIAHKIRSYAHQDLNHGEFVDVAKIQEKLDNNRDILNQGLNYGEPDIIPIDDTFPAYLVKNQDKYKHLIK